ncbi:MAG: hypothetical protein IAE94_05230 [Chthoniobacterales bacterium]|nr:hypothetical protein [Chthoniobacterales bacterium]
MTYRGVIAIIVLVLLASLYFTYPRIAQQFQRITNELAAANQEHQRQKETENSNIRSEQRNTAEAIQSKERGVLLYKQGFPQKALQEFIHAWGSKQEWNRADICYALVSSIAAGQPEWGATFGKQWVNSWPDRGRDWEYILLYTSVALHLSGHSSEARSLLQQGLRQAKIGDWPYPLIQIMVGEVDAKTVGSSNLGNGDETEIRTFSGLKRFFDSGWWSPDLDWVNQKGQTEYYETVIVRSLARQYQSRPESGNPRSSEPKRNQPLNVGNLSGLVGKEVKGLPLTGEFFVESREPDSLKLRAVAVVAESINKGGSTAFALKGKTTVIVNSHPALVRLRKNEPFRSGDRYIIILDRVERGPKKEIVAFGTIASL